MKDSLRWNFLSARIFFTCTNILSYWKNSYCIGKQLNLEFSFRFFSKCISICSIHVGTSSAFTSMYHAHDCWWWSSEEGITSAITGYRCCVLIVGMLGTELDSMEEQKMFLPSKLSVQHVKITWVGVRCHCPWLNFSYY